MIPDTIFLLRVLLVGSVLFIDIAALSETHRLQEYEARNYTWPIQDHFVPNTDGWKRSTGRRIAQVERLTDDDARYNGWISVMAAAVATPNFTEHGWGLTRAPAALIDELKASLQAGMAEAQEEAFINVIVGEGKERPLFVRQPMLNRKVLNELKPMHEEWSGVPLTGAIACKFSHVEYSKTRYDL